LGALILDFSLPYAPEEDQTLDVLQPLADALYRSSEALPTPEVRE